MLGSQESQGLSTLPSVTEWQSQALVPGLVTDPCVFPVTPAPAH